MVDVKDKIKKLLGKVEDPEVKQELEDMLEKESEGDLHQITEPSPEASPPAKVDLPTEAVATIRELQQKSVKLEHIAGQHYIAFHRKLKPIEDELNKLIALFEEEKQKLVKQFAPLGEEENYVLSSSEEGSGLVLLKLESE